MGRDSDVRADRLTAERFLLAALLSQSVLNLRVVREERRKRLLEVRLRLVAVLRELLLVQGRLPLRLLVELGEVVGVCLIPRPRYGVVCGFGVEDAGVPVDDAAEEEADAKGEDGGGANGAGDDDGKSGGSVVHCIVPLVLTTS